MDEYQEYKLFKTHPYAIVDATLRDEIPATWEQSVIAPTFLGADTTRCPLLVDLRSISDTEKDAYIKRLEDEIHGAEATWCSLLLASEAPIDKLAKHLAQRLVLKMAGGEPPKQFRYFDPGTFLQLPAILGEDGMAWLLGPVTSVGIPWMRELSQYEKPDTDRASFILKNEHYQSLYRVGIVNHVQNDIDVPDVPNQSAWLARVKTINNLINRAMLHNILDQTSIVLFCKHGLIHHSRFDEHSKLIQILTILRQQTSEPEDKNTYYFLVQDLSADEWQQIEQDLLAPQNDHQMVTSQESK